MKYLALDIGQSKIGVATTDDSGIVATPKCYLETKNDLIHRLGEIIEQERPQRLIVGLPRHQSGEVNESAEQIKEFAKGLHHEYNLEVDFEDESGTTKIAEERLRAAGKSAREIKELVDAESAAVILESYLART